LIRHAVVPHLYDGWPQGEDMMLRNLAFVLLAVVGLAVLSGCETTPAEPSPYGRMPAYGGGP